MKAMILAAGLGTRLLPLTEDRPKALVQVGGRTLLEIALQRLQNFGIRDVIVNVHHFAGMVIEYLRRNNCFGMAIEISREEALLDTGGALKHAAWFFLAESGENGPDNGRDEPFLLHNVDVVHTIDLARMVRWHESHQPLATLAVQRRASSRYLLFDEEGELCGRLGGDGNPQLVRGCRDPQPLAFSGIHVVSRRLLAMMPRAESFSIIDLYLRLSTQGQRIIAFPADEYGWRDAGTLENLALAEADARRDLLHL